MDHPVFVCDFDGCIASQQKVWWENKDKIGVYKLISDHDSWLISKIKNRCHILILSGDKRVGKQWSKDKGIDFVYALHDKFNQLHKYLKEHELSEYFYLGDAMPDFECMINAKVAFYPKDASLILKNHAKNHIHMLELNTNGGYGCFEDMTCTLQDLGFIEDLGI